MISLNTEQHLGLKAFILLLIRRTLVVYILIIIIIVAVSAHSMIISSISSTLKTAGQTIYSDSSIASGFSQVIVILFFVTLILFTLGLIISLLEYKNYAFTLEEFDLKMRKGIFDRKEISISYRQIQDVNLEQSLGYQILGLSKLTIITAGHEEADEHESVEIILEPINEDVAVEIRSKLQREIGVQVIESEKKADEEAKV